VAKNSLSVFLLTRALDVGGAQRQLVVLAKALHDRGHSVQVGVFYGGGALAAELEGSGIEIVDLRKRGRWDLLPVVRQLVRELRRRRPDVIYTFLGGANLIAAIAKPFVRKSRLIWSIRASNMDLANYDWAHRLAYKVERSLSPVADRIIANSSAGAAFAVRNGFPAEKIAVVPNGIDTDRFRPDADLRAAQRRKFGLADDEIAIGVLARLDPMKGHAVFLQAASRVAPVRPKVRFLCVGEGSEMARFEQMARELGIAALVSFHGEQEPVATLNAFDIACSCSVWGEGFSNAIAEAMACGLPCVVTDAGDSAAIVGGTGTIVPVGSPEALANAIEAEIRGLPTHDSQLPRARILENFSISAMVDGTLEVFRSAEAAPSGGKVSAVAPKSA
jgi:glycosyltransferase involved in cell wall biosynthesis